MAITCETGTVIPTNNTLIKCDELRSSDCIIFEQAMVYLGLPINSTLTTVIAAMLASLVDARERIADLEGI